VARRQRSHRTGAPTGATSRTGQAPGDFPPFARGRPTFVAALPRRTRVPLYGGSATGRAATRLIDRAPVGGVAASWSDRPRRGALECLSEMTGDPPPVSREGEPPLVLAGVRNWPGNWTVPASGDDHALDALGGFAAAASTWQQNGSQPRRAVPARSLTRGGGFDRGALDQPSDTPVSPARKVRFVWHGRSVPARTTVAALLPPISVAGRLTGDHRC